MQRRVNLDRIPRPRMVIEFEFPGDPSRYNYWFVIEPTGASVCLQDPKFDVDVIVTADIAAFYRVWLGRMTFAEAFAEATCVLTEYRPTSGHFNTGLHGSPMADTVRAALPSER